MISVIQRLWTVRIPDTDVCFYGDLVERFGVNYNSSYQSVRAGARAEDPNNRTNIPDDLHFG
jgi:hypothetical protein